MNSGPEYFFVAFFGLFFATAGLAVYLYAAYRSGQWLGARASLNRPVGLSLIAIALCVLPLSLWPFLTDWNAFIKIGIAMAFYVLNAFPLTVAFGSAVELRKEQLKRRFKKNVDDWLGDWECEPAHHLSDEED